MLGYVMLCYDLKYVRYVLCYVMCIVSTAGFVEA